MIYIRRLQEKLMELKVWLAKNRITVVEFSRIVDYSRGHLSGVINGSYKCGRRLAKTIEKATKGEVKAEELMTKKIINV
jgi:hypothetical protein